MSSQLSAQAMTAQTAITRMSVRRCSTLPRQRGSSTAPKCPTSRSMAMLCSPVLGREDHPWLGNSPASGISCVAPAQRPELVFLAFAVVLAQLAPLAVEHHARELVPSLAAVELHQYAAPVVLVVDVRQHVEALHQAAPLGAVAAGAGQPFLVQAP